MNQKQPWHAHPFPEVLRLIRGHASGLSAQEAAKRLEQYGPNALPDIKPESWLIIFFRQFQSALIYILCIAGIVLYFIDERLDTIIIGCILLINAVIGTIQEGRAKNTLVTLKKFTQTKATVLRDNKEVLVPSSEVVPGDILILSEGEKIAADARLLVTNELKINEAALTGESGAVRKTIQPVDKNALVTEWKNMALSGTHIVSGNGQAIVVATGLETFIGNISKQIVEIDKEIPLKKNIDRLAKAILISAAALIAMLVLHGLLIQGDSMIELFKVAVAIAVSVVPEGLPIVVTLILATGVSRMSKQNVLVKRLQAVEALGQARVIAVDKTGTITRNEMVIQQAYSNASLFNITGEGYEPKGEALRNGESVLPTDTPELIMLGRTAALCANAHVSYDPKEKSWHVSGDPTEAALLVLGEKMGFEQSYIKQEYAKIQDVPFSHETKYHACLHKEKRGQYIATAVGSPEAIIDLCDTVWHPKKAKKLTAKQKSDIEKQITAMAKQGLRVLAIAVREGGRVDINQSNMPKLSFAGLVGMKDGLRAEAHGALQQAKEAGARVVMITGDHAVTAQAIAQEAGIYTKGDLVITGSDLETMSDSELANKLPKASVFARVTPQHKLKIVQAYQKRGDIIAMTGDGVNDAPSLVAADLGVAMGNIGTEVAKDAADLVLLDDNFGNIAAAIEEGRHIYQAIKKVTLYLVSTNMGEVLIIVPAVMLGFPLPIAAAQILWLNLVTDGFLDVALGMDPKEEGLLQKKSHKPAKYILDKPALMRAGTMAVTMMIVSLAIFFYYLEYEPLKAQTMVLTAMAAFEWFNVWNCRSERASIFSLNPFSNLYLVGAIILVIALQFAAVYAPFMNTLLRTVPLEPRDWLLAIAAGSSILIVEEARKSVRRAMEKKTAPAPPQEQAA